MGSLRGRLVGSLLLVFGLGLGGALGLGPVEGRWLNDDDLGFALEEPYQDLFVLVPFSLVAVVLIWLVSGWSLRSLAAASRDAARVGAANPGARIATRALPGEIRPLVDAVNGALDRMAEAYAAEQRFVANAAHALRTPLTVLGLRIQRTRQESVPDWDVIEGDLAEVNRLASQLLDLARKEHTSQFVPIDDAQTVNLSRIVRETAAVMVPIADEAGRLLEVDLPTSLTILGRAEDLRDLVQNLLENALVHGRGTIRLSGQTAAASDGRPVIWLTVTDEGSGVPSELRQVVFERFRKASPLTSGHGLGLSIVHEVARGHGGSVAFVDGDRCQVRVSFPVPRAS